AELSDVISFHSYDHPDIVRDKIEWLQNYNLPIVCTEFLCRQVGNTFSAILPIFTEYGVGWYFWGLVAGKTQTYLPWESKPGDPQPAIWQHDLLRPDGTPYDESEIKLLRK
ncbi:MAG: 1,4-beta-xylanase, partial [Crenarchaeota archaeon]|nr:1,4-beta-xylanase [Thermoproteota archaeon]